MGHWGTGALGQRTSRRKPCQSPMFAAVGEVSAGCRCRERESSRDIHHPMLAGFHRMSLEAPDPTLILALDDLLTELFLATANSLSSLTLSNFENPRPPRHAEDRLGGPLAEHSVAGSRVKSQGTCRRADPTHADSLVRAPSFAARGDGQHCEATGEEACQQDLRQVAATRLRTYSGLTAWSGLRQYLPGKSYLLSGRQRYRTSVSIITNSAPHHT